MSKLVFKKSINAETNKPKSDFQRFIDQTIALLDANFDEKQAFRQEMQNIADTLSLDKIFNKLTEEKKPRVSKRNPDESVKISGYNLFSACVNGCFKKNNVSFNMEIISKIWKETIPNDVKVIFNEKAKEYTETMKENQPSLKKELQHELYETYLCDIKIDAPKYKRDFFSYREIRKQMKLNNSKIDENIYVMWNKMKTNKHDFDSFFDENEHFHPKYQQDNESNEGNEGDDDETFPILE